MTTPPHPAGPAPGELAALRQQYPTWRFGTLWASATTTPTRRIWATRNGILLTAWTTHELRHKLATENPD
jgi:hypothetical protein